MRSRLAIGRKCDRWVELGRARAAGGGDRLPAARAGAGGERDRGAGGARPALVPSGAAGEARGGGRGSDDRGAGSARQVPAAGAGRSADAGHAPADDRQPGPGRGREQARPLRGDAALRGRALDLRAPPACPLPARRRARALVHRPAPLRRGLPDRRRRARRALRPRSGSSRSPATSRPRPWERWPPVARRR